MSIKQKIINNEISYHEACTDYYNDLTQEDVDIIVENYPWVAAGYLNQHPLLTEEQVDVIVERQPEYAAEYLSHRFSEENIAYLANHYPQYLKELFK